ncbi:sensor histidine kinase [Streptomyces sp. NPDC093546]|uniref:sensor histidine kinase n=1 Tax=Streptomyces sp. NPDC093546 TaxID=3366040 RepID=UPI00380FD51A
MERKPGAGRETGRLVAWAVAAVCAAVVGTLGYVRTGAEPSAVVVDVLTGLAYATAGLIALWRRPANGTGRLMLAEGLTWFIGNLQGFDQPLLIGMGAWWEALNLAVLAHLLLAFPEGRVGRRRARMTVGAAYALVAVGGLVRALCYDPAADPGSSYLLCEDCRGNALLLVRDPAVFAGVDLAYRWVGAGLTLWVAALMVSRWLAGSPAYRRVLVPVAVPLAIAVAFVGWEVLYVLHPGLLHGGELLPLVLSDLAQVALPVAFLVGLFRIRLRRADVGNLVIAAGPDPSPAQLQTALREVLGDPTLRLGIPHASVSGLYTDPEGRPIGGPARGRPAAGAAVTPLGPGCTPPAVLVHDRALAQEPELMEAVSASVGLCLRTMQLAERAARNAERARELQMRLLSAEERERRRLERNLHDGAQGRLVFALMGLRRIGTQWGRDPQLLAAVDETEQTLRTALTELRELARGLHPAVLAREGLRAALTALADESPIPVVVMADQVRLPELVETTAYYVVCEALSNAGKHSGARAVTVTVRREALWLVVEVVDDGVGGADPAGSGLRGLADRVAAVGGRLRVSSPVGDGTRIEVELPCG